MKGPPSRPDPEGALIQRAQDGQEDALRALLHEISPAVQQWSLAITGDPDDAADLVQEVLILVVRKLPAYRGDSRFLTWLYTVTRNQALDAHRKRSRQEEKMKRLGVHLRTETRSPPDPEGELDGRTVLDLVSGFLDELPARQREVFQLADLQGLSSTEIAGVLGIRPGGVRSALFKARTAIRRRILEQHPEFSEEYGS